MRKDFLILTGLVLLGLAGFLSAQVLTGQETQPLGLRKPNTRFQAVPTYQHQNRPPFKLNNDKKKGVSEKSKNQFFPLTPLPTVPLNKVILRDKKGKPVTLFPNLKAKNYSTIFQDKKP